MNIVGLLVLPRMDETECVRCGWGGLRTIDIHCGAGWVESGGGMHVGVRVDMDMWVGASISGCHRHFICETQSMSVRYSKGFHCFPKEATNQIRLANRQVAHRWCYHAG